MSSNSNSTSVNDGGEDVDYKQNTTNEFAFSPYKRARTDDYYLSSIHKDNVNYQNIIQYAQLRPSHREHDRTGCIEGRSHETDRGQSLPVIPLASYLTNSTHFRYASTSLYSHPPFEKEILPPIRENDAYQQRSNSFDSPLVTSSFHKYQNSYTINRESNLSASSTTRTSTSISTTSKDSDVDIKITLIVQPAQYQICNYNIYPTPAVSFTPSVITNSTISVTVVESTSNIEIPNTFMAGDTQTVVPGGQIVFFTGLKLKKMNGIKSEMNALQLRTMESFSLRFRMGDKYIDSDPFKLVSSSTQLPNEVKKLVRPMKRGRGSLHPQLSDLQLAQTRFKSQVISNINESKSDNTNTNNSNHFITKVCNTTSSSCNLSPQITHRIGSSQYIANVNEENNDIVKLAPIYTVPKDPSRFT